MKNFGKQEEEIRKMKEELLMQCQKRIAERTSASGYVPVSQKKLPLESKTSRGLMRNDKNKLHSTARETNRKGFSNTKSTSRSLMDDGWPSSSSLKLRFL